MSLTTVEQLVSRQGSGDLRVVDVRWVLGEPGRGRMAYDKGHLPGAVHLDLDTDFADLAAGPGRHPLPQPAAFITRMGDLGIGSDETVVIYDDVGGWVAARLWWMLDNLGHARVSVLDGGIAAWESAGLPLSTEVAAWPPTRLALPRAAWSGTIHRDALRSRLGDVVLLDARAGPRYRGETEPIDPAAGHIPTALNRPVAENLTADGLFRAAAHLAAAFEAIGAGSAVGSETVTSCGSGVSACHHALAMRVAGLPDPILYVGSWSDWSTADFPVATGPDPGSPPD